jgi:hypothetical protein
MNRTVLAVLVAGLLVALGLGVYGRVHSPASYPVDVTPFTGVNYVKAWLTSLTAVCALAQLASGPALVRRVDSDSVILETIHRWSGRLAILASVPVAVDCLYAMGFQVTDTRVLVHSCFGCLFYGAFTVKMLAIGRSGLPRWMFPLLGGLMFTCVALLWLTSALWLFNADGIHL